MTTYLDNCGDGKEWCAKCEQPECCKRLAPYGFPYAIKETEASLMNKLTYRGKVVDTSLGVTWLVK